MSNKTEREYRQNMLTILNRFYRGRGGSLLTKDESKALDYAISSIKTDLKYDLLYEETIHIADTDKMIEPTIKDCISRVEARKAILDHQYSDSFCEEHNIDHSINTGMALIALSDLPSVIPQEPKTGHWIPRNSFLLQYKCSECGLESEKYNYCPNCGSRNEVEE